MYYIRAISSITHQASFEAENVFDILSELSERSETHHPEYRKYISPLALRRLSPVLKMGMTCALQCQTECETPFDAISVGTSLGCLTDTEKFLTALHADPGSKLSPTSFIQSTHNTISGQISLELKNHAYNMTHTQQNLSFEMALIDAMLCCNEGRKNVLLGAADEAIPFLERLRPELIPSGVPLTSGATFAVLTPHPTEKRIYVAGCRTIDGVKHHAEAIESFLKSFHLTLSDIQLQLVHDDSSALSGPAVLNYLRYSGLYYTASAFAFHLAHDWLIARKAGRVLVVNEICPGSLGLTLLGKDEA